MKYVWDTIIMQENVHHPYEENKCDWNGKIIEVEYEAWVTEDFSITASSDVDEEGNNEGFGNVCIQ